MSTYMTTGLYAWDVALENGETRQVLSAMVPTGFASPVISAVRGPAYPVAAPPAVALLVPAAAPVGTLDFNLHVHGTAFRTGDVILWNGGPVATDFVSNTELIMIVDMDPLTTPQAIPVQVRALNGAESNTVTFDVQPAR